MIVPKDNNSYRSRKARVHETRDRMVVNSAGLPAFGYWREINIGFGIVPVDYSLSVMRANNIKNATSSEVLVLHASYYICRK
jgi:hypothetical protein